MRELRTTRDQEELEDWQQTLARLAEFERLYILATGAPLGILTHSKSTDFFVGLGNVFHEVAAEFEEEEGPQLLKSLRAGGASRALAKKNFDSTLLHRVITECERRGIRLSCDNRDPDDAYAQR